MKKAVLFMVMFLFGISAVSAQDSSNNLLKNVQEKFRSTNSFSADITYQRGNKSKSSGKIWYKKDNKFRLELGNLTLAFDGETAYNFNKKENKVIISTADDEGSDFTMFNVEKILQDYPQKSDVKIEGNVITLTAKDDEAEFGIVKLWINNDNFIQKAEIAQPSGVINIDLKNIKLDQDLADSQFTLNPPEGTRVIDLR